MTQVIGVVGRGLPESVQSSIGFSMPGTSGPPSDIQCIAPAVAASTLVQMVIPAGAFTVNGSASCRRKTSRRSTTLSFFGISSVIGPAEVVGEGISGGKGGPAQPATVVRLVNNRMYRIIAWRAMSGLYPVKLSDYTQPARFVFIRQPHIFKAGRQSPSAIGVSHLGVIAAG
jgi:hypothetical protein